LALAGRAQEADLVLEGRVFTGERERPEAEAVAVRGPWIVAVGTRADVAPWIGPGTRTIDAGAGSVVAGFNDAHCHFSVGSAWRYDVDLFSARSRAEILARVRAHREARPEDEVIEGMGWDLADMPEHEHPLAAWLDEVVDDRPVLLWSEGPHAVWVNTAALERARIDGVTPLPPGVVARLDAEGEPTGLFLGRGLFTLFPFVQPPDLEAMRAGLRSGLAEAARLGVTSVQDMVVPALLPLLAELCDRGELGLRFHVWVGLGRGGGVEEARDLARRYGRADWITFGTLKGGVDGMPSLRTAALLASYADDPSTRGPDLPPEQRLAAAVAGAHEAGMRVALHATGDAGVRAALEAFRASPRDGLRDRIEHAFVVDPADVPRLAEAGTIVSVQPSFLARDLAQGDLWERRLGAERCAHVLPLRALEDAGVTLAFGTDFALNPLDPRLGLAAATGRRARGEADGPAWHAEQCLTMAEALRAYTLGSAMAEGAAERKGHARARQARRPGPVHERSPRPRSARGPRGRDPRHGGRRARGLRALNPMASRSAASAAAGSMLAIAAACAAPSSARFPAGNELLVCGERVPVAAPVVLWTMEPRYDAAREGPRFSAAGAAGKRYRPGRGARSAELAAASARDGWTRAHLAEQVDLLVVHYDACGTSRACFRVLHDERQLSAHFLLDLDGTIYQTLDLRDQAWHARAANPRSIGVELAHRGAFPPEDARALARGVEWTEDGVRLALPADGGGLRTRGFVARPARAGLLAGAIHGERLLQHDFTREQYESLAALAAALARAFPRLVLEAPRDERGAVRTDALTEEELGAFRGIVGHWHLQREKRDPGPAFDWERFLAAARARFAAAAPRGP
jgi:hypothetical protein